MTTFNPTTRKQLEACPICFDPMEENEEILAHVTVSQEKAQHAFHALCLADWLKRNPSCPTCREKAYIPVSISDVLKHSPLAKLIYLTCSGAIFVCLLFRFNNVK